PRAHFERHRQIQSAGRSINAGAALECSSDHFLGDLVLMPDRSAGQNETAQAATPKGFRVGNEICLGVLGDVDLDEPGSSQQLEKFFRLAETEHVVTLR